MAWKLLFELGCTFQGSFIVYIMMFKKKERILTLSYDTNYNKNC